MCKSIEDRIIGGMFGLAVGEAEAIAPDGADQKSWFQKYRTLSLYG